MKKRARQREGKDKKVDTNTGKLEDETDIDSVLNEGRHSITLDFVGKVRFVYKPSQRPRLRGIYTKALSSE